MEKKYREKAKSTDKIFRHLFLEIETMVKRKKKGFSSTSVKIGDFRPLDWIQ